MAIKADRSVLEWMESELARKIPAPAGQHGWLREVDVRFGSLDRPGVLVAGEHRESCNDGRIVLC